MSFIAPGRLPCTPHPLPPLSALPSRIQTALRGTRRCAASSRRAGCVSLAGMARRSLSLRIRSRHPVLPFLYFAPFRVRDPLSIALHLRFFRNGDADQDDNPCTRRCAVRQRNRAFLSSSDLYPPPSPPPPSLFRERSSTVASFNWPISRII